MNEVQALQSCLAAEHADLFGYGVVGGVLAGVSAASGPQSYADACYVAHRTRRDRLTAVLAELGQTPVAAEPVYRLPGPVAGLSACEQLARQLERRTAAVYALAVANTVSDSRAMAVDALTDCAVREVAWGAPLNAFPGVGQP